MTGRMGVSALDYILRAGMVAWPVDKGSDGGVGNLGCSWVMVGMFWLVWGVSFHVLLYGNVTF